MGDLDDKAKAEQAKIAALEWHVPSRSASFDQVWLDGIRRSLASGEIDGDLRKRLTAEAKRLAAKLGVALDG